MSFSPLHKWRVFEAPQQFTSFSGTMARLLDWSINLILPVVILLHLLASPYTKVEESFNIQAIHDIIEYGITLRDSSTYVEQHYDHVGFPGSVPRTFAGALVLSGLAQPFSAVLSSSTMQLFVRAILGLATAGSLLLIRAAVDTAYGKVAGRWFVLLQACQFHVMYYASRTLPNIFAFVLTNTALSRLLLANAVATRSTRSSSRRQIALFCLTVAGVVFRSEIAILLAMETIQMLVQRRASLMKMIIPAGLTGVVTGLVLTISIDTLFWRRLTWPEMQGFYYNTILGKSSDWGTSPFHFYFLNALPRLLLNPMIYLVCIPVALAFKATRQTSQDILVPHLAFILVYSLLPHKEWRFIIYSVPALTAVASGGAAWIWNRQAKSALFRILSILLVASTLLSFVASTGILYISSLNYPGGDALRTLHQLETAPRKHIYLDNLACQTGVTRFQQLQPTWIYDKTENQTELSKAAFWQQFDFVITEDPQSAIGSWSTKMTISAFDGVTLRPGDQNAIPLTTHAGMLYNVQQLYNRVTLLVRTRLTKGYWPAVMMKKRLHILERQLANQDLKLSIQM